MHHGKAVVTPDRGRFDSLTPQEFKRAVQKGQGRAIVFLQDHESTPYRWIILRAIIRYIGYAWQEEGDRTWYLRELMRLSGCEEEYREIAIRAFWKARRNRDRWQLDNLLMSFALDGFEPARGAIYDAFNSSEGKRRANLAERIAKTDGSEGLLFVIESYGPDLSQDLEFDAKWWREGAEEKDGKERVAQVLSDEAETPAVKRFLQVAFTEERRKKPKNPQVKGLTWSQVRTRMLEMSEAGESSYVTGRYMRAWTAVADADQLVLAATEFENENEPGWLSALAKGLDRIYYPLPLDTVLNRIRTADGAEYHSLCRALRDRNEPEIREVAIELLADEDRWFLGLDLLTSTALPEDEGLIMTVLNEHRQDPDWFYVHSACMDVDAIARDRTLDVRQMLAWVYEESPCSVCREIALDLMVDRGAASKEILAEALFDAEGETRRKAAEVLRNSSQS
jgi:hypothetical protein